MHSKAVLFAVGLALLTGACADRGRPFDEGNIPPDKTVGGPNCLYDGGKFTGCVVEDRKPQLQSRTVMPTSQAYQVQPQAAYVVAQPLVLPPGPGYYAPPAYYGPSWFVSGCFGCRRRW